MLSPLILNKIGGFEMAKFGRKNHVNLDPLSYSSCLLGEAKVGKTTLVRQVCEKLVGEDGSVSYTHLDYLTIKVIHQKEAIYESIVAYAW